MKAISQAIVLLWVGAAAHAAEKVEPSKPAASAVAEQAPEPMRTDRLDPAFIERQAARQRAPKAPAFPAERR